MKTLEFVKSEIKKEVNLLASKYETTVKELFFGDEVLIFFNEPILEFSFKNGYFIYSDGNEKEPIGTQFTCAFKTPKGYISSKKIDVNIKDKNNVTLQEASELLKFNTDAIKNNFDPFYKENDAKRKNNSAWNYVSSNYLQDDCR
jgi:hypothetical protein